MSLTAGAFAGYLRIMALTPRWSRLSVLVLVAALGACDSALAPGGTLDEPLVDVAADAVDAGAIVDMRVRNLSASSWYFNACSSPRLQRRVDGEWVDAPNPLILCTADLELLRGGQEVTIGVGVPMGHEPGTYRIRFRIARRDGVEVAPATNTFLVQ